MNSSAALSLNPA